MDVPLIHIESAGRVQPSVFLFKRFRGFEVLGPSERKFREVLRGFFEENKYAFFPVFDLVMAHFDQDRPKFRLCDASQAAGKSDFWVAR